MKRDRDVVLHPGELYFGSSPTRIGTLLGSCVSICIWHPKLKIGGMCHYLLPTRGGDRAVQYCAKYADEAFFMFLKELEKSGTKPHEYEAKLFGGGNMFHGKGQRIHRHRNHLEKISSVKEPNVASLNVAAARDLARLHGFSIKAEDLGGLGYREVIFDLQDGRAWSRHRENAPREEAC